MEGVHLVQLPLIIFGLSCPAIVAPPHALNLARFGV